MKWEYLIVDIDRHTSTYNAQKTFNEEFGDWELVSVDNGVGYFKRPSPPQQQKDAMEYEKMVSIVMRETMREDSE